MFNRQQIQAALRHEGGLSRRWFMAYEQMVQDDPDIVFHLGDYIYEYEAGRNGKVRTHHGPEIESLGDYRVRHAQYRSDRLLQAMHHACPWIVTWDDHEVDNNYAADVSEQDGIDPVEFLYRRWQRSGRTAGFGEAKKGTIPVSNFITPNVATSATS